MGDTPSTSVAAIGSMPMVNVNGIHELLRFIPHNETGCLNL
jgi:hypothetical protein